MTKILAVDDSPSLRQMVAFTLKGAGHDVSEASDGVEALGIARGQAFDLVITDINMPNMDGLAFLRAVRSDPDLRKTPFIMVTGRGDKELVTKAAQAGVNNYVIKPFTVEILKKKLEAVVGHLEIP